MKQSNSVRSALYSFAAVIMISGCASTPEQERAWGTRFDNRLLSMGRNNWIIITEAAYSRKLVNGEEIFVTRKTLPSVIETVLSKIGKSDHATVTAWITSELEHIPDRDAPGATKLDREIRRLLNEAKVTTMVVPEQDIVKKIESEAGNYYILVLKTSTPVPYSSVYLKIDTRYWDEEREKRLREALRSSDKP